jgi:hypothetical protein
MTSSPYYPFKVVGLLLRARKYNLVEFEGETLFQGQNDLTPIFLIRSENLNRVAAGNRVSCKKQKKSLILF